MAQDGSERTGDNMHGMSVGYCARVARLNSATASLTVTFNGDTGLVTYNWDSAMVDETKVGVGSENAQGGISPDTQMVITVNGITTSEFEDVAGVNPGEGIINYGPAEGTLNVRISLNGIDRGSTPYNASDLNWTSQEQATYECKEDLLLLTPVIPGFHVEPLRFQRATPTEP